MATQGRTAKGGQANGEVHARKHRGELVVDPDTLDEFLRSEHLAPPHPEYGGREVEVEVRTASPAENPPNGAVWLTALGAHVSLKADPVEVLRVLAEAGILDELRRDGKLPFP